MKTLYYNIAANAFSFLLFLSPLHAATFTVVADQDSSFRCDRQTDGSPVTGSCSIGSLNLEGRSDYGSLGVRGSLTQDTSGFSSGSVSASVLDELFFSVSDGQFVIPIDIAGTLSTDLSGPSAGGASAVSGVSLLTDTETIFSRNLVETNIVKEFRDSVGADGINLLKLDIVDGRADLSAVLSIGISCKGSFFGGSCATDASFYSSARFLSGSIFDVSGNEVTGATVTSSSGFDYLVGVDPHNVSPIPLPASLPMLTVSLIGFGYFGRRMRKHSLT